MRLTDADKLEQDLRKEAARIIASDDYGKDRQRLARGLKCRANGNIAPTVEQEWMVMLMRLNHAATVKNGTAMAASIRRRKGASDG